MTAVLRIPARGAAAGVLVAAAVVGGALLGACDGSASKLDAASFQVSLGHLDRAEAILEDAAGPKVDALRERIEEQRAHRSGVLAALQRFRDARGDKTGLELQAELDGLLEGETDYHVREWITQEMSDTADWVAERDARKPFRKAYVPGLGLAPPPAGRGDAGPERPEVPPRRGRVDDPLLDKVLDDVQGAREARSWSQALAILDMVVADAPELAGEVADLREETARMAALDAEDLVARAAALERREGPESALALVVLERWRFPDAGASGAVHQYARSLREQLRREDEMAALVRGTAVAGAPSAPPDPEPDPPREAEPVQEQSSIDLAVQAVKEAEDGRLERARELWLAAAEGAGGEAERARLRMRAQDAELRLFARREVARAFAAQPSAFADLAAGDVRPDGLVWNGEPIEWRDLDWSDYEALCERSDLRGDARVGYALEKLHHGRAEGPTGGLADLWRLQRRGELDEERCWTLVAAWRREPVPPGGYVWREGEWISRTELEREELGERVDELARRLARADGDEREEAYRALDELALTSDVARLGLVEVLRERWSDAVGTISRSYTLRRLEGLARQRSQLDALREHALELVFDEEAYFYPYDPPADPRKTHGDYLRVQRQVDERLRAVRELWEGAPEVPLPKELRRALADVDWVLGHAALVAGSLSLPEDWPAWVSGLDPGLESVTLATFAWDAREARELATDRAIVALNEARWEREQEGAAPPTEAEREQVRITNAYRRLMGRRLLAWNPKIQAAARWHSDYQASTGNFGHFEPENPEHETPHDRMRAMGYGRGACENCHVGRSDPRAAHDAWVRSSDHHRNLLGTTHTEMASAVAGGYWTQNFGSGAEFESELDEWRD